MKIRLFIIAAIMLAAASFAAAQTKMKPKEMMSKPATVEQALKDKEQAAWMSIVEKKYDAFGAMLADDYQGFYPEGSMTKTQELTSIKTLTFTGADVSDMKVQMLGGDAAIVTSDIKATLMMPDGKSMTEMQRSVSVWKRSGKIG